MAARKMSGIQILRRVILGIFFVGITTVTILHQRVQGVPTIDALDPFGGLETLLKFVAGGEVIKKVEPGTVVLFAGVVALGIVVARFFCGWFCAFGALQGIFGWLGRKLLKKRLVVPPKADAWLRYLKYLVLVAVIYLTWRAGDLVIRPYDPMAAYAHLSAGLEAVWGEFAIGFLLLLGTLVFSFLYERAFCKYVCPLGAMLGLVSRVPIFRIRRLPASCISCSKCDKVCPMNVDVSTPEVVKDPECIACMECVTSCPTKVRSLEPTLGGRMAKLGLVVALGLAIYGVAAAAASVVGLKPASLSELAAEGELKVEDIKGSSTWEGVAESFGIELEKLYRETGVDMAKVPRMTMLKDTAALGPYEDFTPDTVRIAVAKILGVPYTPEDEGEAMAKPAEPTISAAPAPAAAPASSAAKAAPAPAAALVVPADFVLEGTMSIREVAAALKASEEAVIAKLGLPASIERDKPLRDLKDKYGFTMPGLKTKIHE